MNIIKFFSKPLSLFIHIIKGEIDVNNSHRKREKSCQEILDDLNVLDGKLQGKMKAIRKKYNETTSNNNNANVESGSESAHITTLDELESIETKLEPLAGLFIPVMQNGILVYGPKGSLKSHIILKVLCQLNTGEAIKILPDFDPNQGKESEKKSFCLYVDGENGEIEDKKRIRLYDERIDRNRFGIICTKTFGANSFTRVISAIKEKVESIPENSIVVTAFDNLNSLLDNACSQTESKQLLNGINEIQTLAQKRNVTFVYILIHHENAEGKPSGSTILEDLCANKIHITETKDYDIKKVIYENHRFCSVYNKNNPFYLDVHHSGPIDDEDIEITYRSQGYDGGGSTKKTEVTDCSEISKNENSWEKTPENEAKILLVCNELIEDAEKEGKLTKYTISYRNVANKITGVTHTTIRNNFKDIIEAKKKEIEGITSIVA